LVPWNVGLTMRESAISSPAKSATVGTGGWLLELFKAKTIPKSIMAPVPVNPKTVTTPVAPLPTTTVSASPSPGKVAVPVVEPVEPPV